MLVFHIPDKKGDTAESKLGAEFVRKVLFGWDSNIHKILVKEPGSKVKKEARIINVKQLPGMKRDIVL